MGTKRFTILHSNDLHGDFYEDDSGGAPKGGFALLSGYLNKVRAEEENVLYVIAGDMLQGSIIDTVFRGISTIELVNYLEPDVVTLGNHELDYGLPHLLFLEKMANFPVVNANLYIKQYYKRLMLPHLVIRKAGFDFLFTGVVTEEAVDAVNVQDSMIGGLVTIEEAAVSVGKIANAYRDSDIDLTVLLTHVGFENDRRLASMMRPEWGVDVIVGGHSHTFMDEPVVENGVIIVQAGEGTDQVGRLDLVVDDDTNSVVDYHWELVSLEQGVAEPDSQLMEYMASYQAAVDRKYNALVGRLARALEHPRRDIETPLGNLVADVIAECAEAEVAMLGSGTIRFQTLGPVVTVGDVMSCLPFDDSLSRYVVSGSQLVAMFEHWMRPERRAGDGQCYQVNGRVRAAYDATEGVLTRLSIDGAPVQPERGYTLALSAYHATKSELFLGISHDDLVRAAQPVVVTTSLRDVFEEWLRHQHLCDRQVEGRITYAGPDVPR